MSNKKEIDTVLKFERFIYHKIESEGFTQLYYNKTKLKTAILLFFVSISAMIIAFMFLSEGFIVLTFIHGVPFLGISFFIYADYKQKDIKRLNFTECYECFNNNNQWIFTNEAINVIDIPNLYLNDNFELLYMGINITDDIKKNNTVLEQLHYIEDLKMKI